MNNKYSFEKENIKVQLIKRNNELWYALYTPYNEGFKGTLKRNIHYTKREFDWNRKAWLVKVTFSKEEIKEAFRIIKNYFEINIDVEIPDIPFGKVFVEDDKLVFDVDYDEDFINDIKQSLGGIFDKKTKNWYVSISKESKIDEVYRIIEEYNIKEDDDIDEYIENVKNQLIEERKKRRELAELSKQKSLNEDYEVSLPDDDDLELYPFQKYAIKMLDLRKKGLIADEMGLGKTVEVLTHLYNHQQWRPVLVIVPSSVKINWKREISKWTESSEDDICVLTGQNGNITRKKDWYIVNYAILHHRLEELLKLDYKAMIIDESHYIKNYKAKRTKSVKKLSENVEHIYCLSGTPMPNRPIELWSQINILNPKVEDFKTLWGNKNSKGFAKKYCNAHENKWGWDVDGASNLDELYNKLRKSVMIRRRKKDVLDELPDKRRLLVPLEIDNRSEYQQAEQNFTQWMNKYNPISNWEEAEILVRMEKLKQIAWKGKYKQMIKWVNDMLEHGDKTVIFAHHRELQSKLYEEYEDISVKIAGGMNDNDKQDAIDEFTNNDDIRLCITSTQAGGTGINLQVSSRAVFTEIGWTSSEHNQAEDRIHRIGQEEQCDIYYLMAENTIEEEIFNLINQKQQKIDEAIDGIVDDSKKGIMMEILKKEDNKINSESLDKFMEE